MGRKRAGVIRVGFIQEFQGNGWLGGSSYYRNLFSAIKDLPKRKIEPVLITSSRSFASLKAQFPDVPVIRLPLLDASPALAMIRRATRVLFGRDPLMERALRAENISIVSHSSYFGRRSPVASIVWIPDFQELTFPDFFSSSELASRLGNTARSSRHASTVLLSSDAALADLKRADVNPVNTAVLRFVANVPREQEILPLDRITATYGLAGKFFHLPNQFWVHKNHSVVLRALALLRREGRAFQIIATGNSKDHRQPQHFESLMATARELAVDDLFKPVGVVPYADLMSLMRHAVAVINPSKFEGWSTTVEEAKSMGKAIILSDIAVHREQAPERSVFFPADDFKLLAQKMSEVCDCWDIDVDSRFVSQAAANLPERRESFARQYEEIVFNTLDRQLAYAKSAISARPDAVSQK